MNRGRYVAVMAREVYHAVWVPHDIPPVPHVVLPRGEERPALVMIANWSGLAECGKRMDGIVAGENGGHDWDRYREVMKCVKCKRKVERELSTRA